MLPAFKILCHFPAVILLLAHATPAVAPMPDNYMVCGGQVPQPNVWGPWPQEYGPDNYTDNMGLCSGAYGLTNDDRSPRNLGCYCFFAGQSKPACAYFNADATLFRWPNLYNDWTFPKLCAERLCACTTRDVRNSYSIMGRLGGGQFEYDSVLDAQPSGVYPYDPDIDTSSVDYLEEEKATTDPDNVSVGDTCGNVCTSNLNCVTLNSTDTSMQCKCKVQSSTVIPGNLREVHISACVVSSALSALPGSSLVGKRDQPDLCPCNSTYVSEGCCGVQDGMVWEPKEAHRGRLLTLEDLDM
ncbi:MAG: hypothetical protein M1828_000726 [Chrysothrix sp. TS-e1954]|nr:MAG: hypothetical protein M1828_000726 [Chrysothrix sp. TS-e1954]